MRAIADADEAIRLYRKHTSARLLRSRAWAQNGDFDAAFADLNKLIQISPTDVMGHVLRGRLHKIKGDQEAAVNDFARAQELNPNLDSGGGYVWSQPVGKRAIAEIHDIRFEVLNPGTPIKGTHKLIPFRMGPSGFAAGLEECRFDFGTVVAIGLAGKRKSNDPWVFSKDGKHYGKVRQGDRILINESREVSVNGERRNPEEP